MTENPNQRPPWAPPPAVLEQQKQLQASEKTARTCFKWAVGALIVNVLSLVLAVLRMGYIAAVPKSGEDYRGMELLILLLTVPLLLLVTFVFSLVGFLASSKNYRAGSELQKLRKRNGILLGISALPTAFLFLGRIL